MLAGIFRLWRTVRHLKLIQIYRRVWIKIYKPNISKSSFPESKNFQGLITQPPAKKPSLVGPTEWNLLNELGKLEEIGWQNSLKSKLWRYNQHYFDDLNAVEAKDRLIWHLNLLDRWIVENPPFSGHGWEPYPTSIRIINWIKWSVKNYPLQKKIEESLALQVRSLRKRVEWHLLGNHLFVNAKALIFAGIYFDGPEAEDWLAYGMRILEKQVHEQILSDGAQFELTPMYHALAIEDILDLINIIEKNRHKIAKHYLLKLIDWRSMVEKMLKWLDCMSHPDGGISFFNDSAFGIALSNSELHDYAKRLGCEMAEPIERLNNFTKSGFVRFQSTRGVLIADLGPIGPDYLPGHAHADTLSFELSVDQQRIFVNSGTSEYGSNFERQRQRGTRAHNTVCVEGINSSEVWSGFRVGARANIKNRFIGYHGDYMYAIGEHDGYARTHEGLTHVREFFLNEKSLKIRDKISSPFQAEARFHCHPEIEIEQTDNECGRLVWANGEKMFWKFSGVSRVDIVDTTWHPEFGKAIKNKCMVAEFGDVNCEFMLKWD